MSSCHTYALLSRLSINRVFFISLKPPSGGFFIADRCVSLYDIAVIGSAQETLFMDVSARLIYIAKLDTDYILGYPN